MRRIGLGAARAATRSRWVTSDGSARSRGPSPRRRADHRPHFLGCRVIVHEYADGTLDISHEDIVIGRYHKNSNRLGRRPKWSHNR